MTTYTPTTDFLTPPVFQGQIVERSFAFAFAANSDAGVIIQRTIDRSDGRTIFAAYRSTAAEFEPWQTPPALGACLGACQIAGEA